MKRLLLLILLVSTSSFSQTEYFTTDGKTIMTETEKDEMLKKISEKFSKTLKKKMYARAVIKETTKKQDSTINHFTLNIIDKRTEKEISRKAYSQLESKKFSYFELESIDGKRYSLDDFKNKPILINFWFTKCAPCIDEMPILNKIYEKYKNDVHFISITYESKKKVKTFLEKHTFKFKHLVNSDKFIKDLEISSYPLNIFIDKNGIVRNIERGIPYIQDDTGKMIMGIGTKFEEILKNMI